MSAFATAPSYLAAFTVWRAEVSRSPSCLVGDSQIATGTPPFARVMLA